MDGTRSTVIGIIGVDSICTHSIVVDTEVLTRFWLEVVPYQYLVLTDIWEAIIFHCVGSSGAKPILILRPN